MDHFYEAALTDATLLQWHLIGVTRTRGREVILRHLYRIDLKFLEANLEAMASKKGFTYFRFTAGVILAVFAKPQTGQTLVRPSIMV